MFKLHLRRTIFFAVLGLVIALIVAQVSPKVYEGRAEMLLGEQTRPGLTNLTDDVAQIIQRGSPQTPQSERQLLRSASVFFDALQRVADRRKEPNLLGEWDRYYLMYDVVGSERKRAQDEEMGSVAQIRVKAFNPEVAADVANEITEVYNYIRLKAARGAVADGVKYLEEQIKTSEANLAKREHDYRDYKKSVGIADYKAQVIEDTTFHGLLNKDRQGAMTELAAVDAEISLEEQQLKTMPLIMEQGYSEQKNPLISQAQGQLEDLRRQRAQALNVYEEDSLQVQGIDAQITALNGMVQEEKNRKFEKTGISQMRDPFRTRTEGDLLTNKVKRANLQRRLVETQAAMDRQQVKIKDLPIKEIEMEDFARQLDIADQGYRRQKTMLLDLKNRSETAGRSALVLSQARKEDEPVAPDQILFAVVGLLGGIAVGLIFSFGVESLRLRVHTSSQLAELTGLPVAATVPLLPKGRAARMLSHLANAGARPAESFRYMAFSMIAKDFAPPRTLMFTGIGGRVGCSTSAAQFALAMAGTGTRTLLVDANVRRASISRSFEMHDKTGLSELLNNKLLPGGEVIQATKHENLSVLPAGAQGDKGVAELSTEQLETILQSLKTNAEVIVIDMPPCDVFADASRLAPYVDEICLVVSATSTAYRNIPQAYDILTRAGGKTISMILTNASPQEEAFSSARAYLAKVE